jgi:hypothetical protein
MDDSYAKTAKASPHAQAAFRLAHPPLAAESIFATRQNLTECNIYFIMAFITTVNAKMQCQSGR